MNRRCFFAFCVLCSFVACNTFFAPVFAPVGQEAPATTDAVLKTLKLYAKDLDALVKMVDEDLRFARGVKIYLVEKQEKIGIEYPFYPEGYENKRSLKNRWRRFKDRFFNRAEWRHKVRAQKINKFDESFQRARGVQKALEKKKGFSGHHQGIE